jgi:hypothetical protein
MSNKARMANTRSKAAPARQAPQQAAAPAPRQAARMPATPAQIAAFKAFLIDIQTTKASTAGQNAGHMVGLAADLNLIPSPPSLSFIQTHADDLVRYIETEHNQKKPNTPWSDATILKKMTTLSLFAGLGRARTPPQVTEETYQRIKAAMTALSSTRNIEASQQKLSARQEKNWVPMDIIEQRAIEVIGRFIDFYNSKRRITATSTDREKLIITDALIAQMFALGIPSRARPSCDAVIENFQDGIPEGRLAVNQKNFIDVHDPKGIIVGCCDDKIAVGKKKEDTWAKPDSWKLDETTSELIMMSLKVWNRTHLFGNRPVLESTFTSWFQRIFTWPAGVSDSGEPVPEKVVGLQILRTIYASTWYATNPGAPQRPGENTTPGEAELARRMRHNPKTQRTDYLKFVDEIRTRPQTLVASPTGEACVGEFVYSKSVAAHAARVRYANNAESIRIKNLERYHEDPQTVNQRRYLRKVQNGERVKKSTMTKWGIYCVDGQLRA